MADTTRDHVALILATGASVSILILTAAALYDALTNPEGSGISQAYSSLLTGTLGVMVGALAGYIGGRGGPVPVIDETPARPVSSPDETHTDRSGNDG